MIHYPVPPHFSPAYAEQSISQKFDLKITEQLADSVFSLPISPHINSESQIFIIELINKFDIGK